MAIRLKVLDGCPVRLKTGADETVLLQTGEGYPIYPEPYTGEYEITPTESEIGLQTNGLMMTSDVTVHGIPTDYVGSAIDRRDSSSISVSGPDVTVPLGFYEDNASVSIASGSAAVPNVNIEKNPTISVSTGGLITATVSTSETVSPVISAGYIDSGSSGTISFSGTATQQLTVKSSSDLSVNGPTVTAPAGFYAESASKSVSNGNIGVPYIVQDAVTNHSVKLTPFYQRTQGWISESGTYSGAAVTVSASDLVSGSDTFTANNTYDVTNLASVTVEVDYSPELQTKTNIDPSLSSQTIYADEGYDGLYSVQINAMPSGTAGTPSATKGAVNNHSITVTPSVTNSTGYITGGTINGTAVTVSASELVSGTYSVTSAGTANVTNYASVSVPSGTAGTPAATKGTVTNHSVTVTPSVTNSAGYISGGSINGTAVTVSASELVSGTLSITSNTTYDVTNYQYVDVNVAGIDISDTTLTADKALAGYYFYTAQGVKTEGAITDGNNIGYGITDGSIPRVGIAKVGYAEIGA